MQLAGNPEFLIVDLSVTPFTSKAAGTPEDRPFPWLVSDFGPSRADHQHSASLIMDMTVFSNPKYLKLRQRIREALERGFPVGDGGTSGIGKVLRQNNRLGLMNRIRVSQH